MKLFNNCDSEQTTSNNKVEQKEMLMLSRNLEQALELISRSTKLAHTSCSGMDSTLTAVLAKCSTLTTALAKCSADIHEALAAAAKLTTTLKNF